MWLFRQELLKAETIGKLFARFDTALTDRLFVVMGRHLINKTEMSGAKRHIIEDENAELKQGNVRERWKEMYAKVRQKDREARRTVKCAEGKVKEGADFKAFKPADLSFEMIGCKTTSTAMPS
ncbi:hypothetical protein [Altererythrobacter rubellus]|uniref:Uncharacterized protein n=1 Tax=Altererythrobacter rubellus TaxID=2173831 RepID=A0A9Y2B8B9_9SPHN|nr:hypothetical protein [Altererythrobacter rubellus]WIW95943.1 hypothetical protein QQX03_02215 [Altererythrobacter rubellus]